MGMADRVSSGVPCISTSSFAHGVTHFYKKTKFDSLSVFRKLSVISLSFVNISRYSFIV